MQPLNQHCNRNLAIASKRRLRCCTKETHHNHRDRKDLRQTSTHFTSSPGDHLSKPLMQHCSRQCICPEERSAPGTGMLRRSCKRLDDFEYHRPVKRVTCGFEYHRPVKRVTCG